MRFEPLRVRIDESHDGIVVDLSEGGAMMQLPAAPPQDRQITLRIEWKDTAVQVKGRIVRSLARRVQLDSAMMARTEYYVAVEFVALSPETSVAVRRIIQDNWRPQEQPSPSTEDRNR